MTPEESVAYEYIKSLDGSWVSEDDLVLLGVDTVDLASIFTTYPLIQLKYDCDQSISHGLRVSLTDVSNDISIADKEWLKPTVNISIRVLVRLDSYNNGSTQYLVHKYNGYRFFITSAGKYRLEVYNGAGTTSYESTSATGLTNENAYWLRADWAYSAGGGNSSVDFKYSLESDVFDSEDVVTWVSVQTVTTAQHNMVHSTSPMYVGGISSGSYAAGIFYAVDILGDNIKRCGYDLSYNSGITIGLDTLFDNLGNVLVINGTANYLMQNNIPKKYYKYQSNMGDFEPI